MAHTHVAAFRCMRHSVTHGQTFGPGVLLVLSFPAALVLTSTPFLGYLLQCWGTRIYLLPARHAGNGLERGYFLSMPTEPSIKRAIAFVDGQNLFYAARNAFGYDYPNYDIAKLAGAICNKQKWSLTRVCFYTGLPDTSDDPFWNHFWTAKLAQMGRQKVRVFSSPLRYRNQTVRLPAGQTHTFLVGQEKGVDVRLALDIVGAAYQGEFDVALVFSQDQDLSEVADELRLIGQKQNRWLKMVSVFPQSPASPNRRGINKSDWIKIDRATYDACLDKRDYRPKVKPQQMTPSRAPSRTQLTSTKRKPVAPNKPSRKSARLRT
jgi:uncharacterized LabA/DUF88 family protein